MRDATTATLSDAAHLRFWRGLDELDAAAPASAAAIADPAVALPRRDFLKAGAVSVWIKAEIDLLFARVSRRANRPLLKTTNPRATLEALIAARYPIYAEADVTVASADVPQDQVADTIVEALMAYLSPIPPAGEAHHAR